MALGVCPKARADRPAAADNSTTQYFPPVGGPQGAGDCTCWSSCYYYNTYTQARDKGLDASAGDPDIVRSPRFLFPLIAQGSWGAECTRTAMQRLADVGCSSLTLHPYGEPWDWSWMAVWPAEAAWVEALSNRPGEFREVRVDTLAGQEIIKQHIADGGLAVTRADFLSNYHEYSVSASGVGISNRVMYMRDGSHWLRHSICVVGYDDNLAYIDSRDRQTHYGAFLIVNSEGPDWGWYNSTNAGTKGFIWIAYQMFLDGEMGWYDYDLDVSPCFDNADGPTMYYHEPRPDHHPLLYAVVGVNHPSRNLLTLSGGIGASAAPEFVGPNALVATPEGDIAIDDSKRVAVDLTDGADLIAPGRTKEVFVALTLDASASSSAGVTSADFFHDFDRDGLYESVSASVDRRTLTAPGQTLYLSVEITNNSAATGDLNCDGAVNAFDIDPFVVALADPAGYADLYPNCSALLADCNGDGFVNAFDIDPFVACLINGGCLGG